MGNEFDVDYYIDIEAISKVCRYPTKEVDNSEIEQIDIFKYEIIKMCIDRVLIEIEDTNENLGFIQKDTQSMSFNMAFNTLKLNNIIKETDGE